MSKLIEKVINLHLFDEGAVANAQGNSQAGNSSVAESNSKPIVKYGKQADDVDNAPQGQEDTTNDREAEFEELINGKYKDLYEAKFKSALDKRFKNQKDVQAELDRYKSVMPKIAEKYKTDNDKDNEKCCAADSANDKVILKLCLLRLKAFEMDLESGEDCKYHRKDYKVSFHHSGKDISIVLYERRSYHIRKDLNRNDLTSNCYQ